MSLKNVSVEDVVSEAQLIYDQARLRLVKDESDLHNAGYHHFSTIMANFRNDIENAYLKLVDAVTEGE